MFDEAREGAVDPTRRTGVDHVGHVHQHATAGAKLEEYSNSDPVGPGST
jgi:hypothetical protein